MKTLNGTELGEYLKNLRGSKTIRQVENLTNVSKSHISRIEKGERHPSPEVLKKLSGCYDATYEKLLVAAGYLSPEMAKEDENPFKNPNIRVLQRAQKNMSDEQLKQLVKIAQSLFPNSFDN